MDSNEKKRDIEINLIKGIEGKNESNIYSILEIMSNEKIFNRNELSKFLDIMMYNNIPEYIIEKLKRIYWKGVLFYDESSETFFSI